MSPIKPGRAAAAAAGGAKRTARKGKRPSPPFSASKHRSERRRREESSSGTSSSSSTASSSPGSVAVLPAGAAAAQQNVRVVARIRPLSGGEREEGKGVAVRATPAAEGSTSLAVEGARAFSFSYDAVLGPASTQEEVYRRAAGDAVEKGLFGGFNVTVLAYGQTGSGKTYTMGTEGGGEGGEGEKDGDGDGDGDGGEEKEEEASSGGESGSAAIGAAPEGEGIIPRAVRDLFRVRSSLPGGAGRTEVELSYLEIYNEEARDLLAPPPPAGRRPPELHLRDADGGVVVQNLTRHPVGSPAAVLGLMAEASSRRVTASTNMNAASSRSHAVCTLYVTIAPDPGAADGGGGAAAEEVRVKLTLVDLAGSERLKRTGAEGARMREGISINKGLFVLGQVVSALSELGQQQHVVPPSSFHIPYRDSKLTRLLQDSLGGNSRTIMVACVSPASSNAEESTNTLRYAERARNIKNAAVRNVVDRSMSPAEAAKLRKENQSLRLQLLQAQMRLASGAAEAAAGRGGGGAEAAMAAAAVLSAGPGAVFDKLPHQGLAAAGHGGAVVAAEIDVEKLEIVAGLRASLASAGARADSLERRSTRSAEDALTASLKADRWRLRHERLVASLEAKGVAVPEEVALDGAEEERKGDLVTQLRRELAESREECRESQTDAEVARATAAAVVAGGGDLSAAEHFALAGEEMADAVKAATGTGRSSSGGGADGEDGSNQSSELSAELVAVDGEIDRKEAMAAQMNKERECMEGLRSHFEEAFNRLQLEVDALEKEKNTLKKVGGGVGGSSQSGKRRGASTEGTEEEERPDRKRMRKRIAELEERIKALKSKAAEHTKSLRMREMAEKKCVQLSNEIAEDKKRRATLQKQLKEAASTRRSEKKAAQQNAARMLRDSRKIQSELQKVKAHAERQAAVLRRRAAEALGKQKKLEEQQRKRKNAAAIRGARAITNSVGVQRKEELSQWLERELNCATTIKGIKNQIEEQNMLLDEATAKKEGILSQGPRQVSAASLTSLESEIDSRKNLIGQLEQNCNEVCRSILGNGGKITDGSSCFIDLSTWQGLTRQEIRLVCTNSFEHLVQVCQQKNELHIRMDNNKKLAVQKAISEERRRHDDTLMKVKLDHSEKIMTLLESTKETVQHQLRMDLTAVGIEGDIDSSTKATIDDMISSYLSGCQEVGDSLKGELNDVKETQDSMKTIFDEVAKDIVAKNEGNALGSTKQKKAKAKAKAKHSRESLEGEVFDLFEEEEDAGATEDSDDSDWAPDTPLPTKKRRSAQSSRKAMRASMSDDEGLAGENIIDSDYLGQAHYESMTVSELKLILKRESLAVSGKKADLIARLRSNKSGATVSESLVESKENEASHSQVSEPPIETENEKAPLLPSKESNRRSHRSRSNEGFISPGEKTVFMGGPRKSSSLLKRKTSEPAALAEIARKKSRTSMAKADANMEIREKKC